MWPNRRINKRNQMTYKLARQLKDAGFKQRNGFHLGAKMNGFFAPTEMETPEDFAYEPTLSQLIEACGDRFKCLFTETFEYEPSSVRIDWVCDGLLEEPITMYRARGSTPEEAVASLWLALNKPTK